MLTNLPASPETPFAAQLAILNAGSTLGRTLPVTLADKLGVYNLLIPSILTSAVLIFALFGATSTGGVITVAVLFGFSSGACAHHFIIYPDRPSR